LVLSPTSSINLGFTTEGRHAVVLIIPSLGVPNWSVIYIDTAPSVDYSHITPEATMVMKKASGGDSPLRQGAGKSSWIPPISR
jgi:hypothetical protein